MRSVLYAANGHGDQLAAATNQELAANREIAASLCITVMVQHARQYDHCVTRQRTTLLQFFVSF